VERIAELVSLIEAPWFSDHLCYTRAGGVSLGTLLPLPRSRVTARQVAVQADAVQRAVGRPLLLENITDYLDIDHELTEAQFITEFLEHSGCGLLLDLTNLHTNAVNHSFDPFEFLDEIPLERVRQVHLAGGHWDGTNGGTLVDSHSSPVPEEVWTLLDHLLSQATLWGILIERDQELTGTFAEIVSDVNLARATVRRHA
jgi:hypothetical protein